MASLDTNVLIRYLVQDDVRQLNAAKRLIVRCITEGQRLFVPITVALELEWVLRSNFNFAKAEVVNQLSGLLATVELTFESETALEHALSLYGRGSADFSDYVHAALAAQAGEQPLWTFDKAAAKAAGARLISLPGQ